MPWGLSPFALKMHCRYSPRAHAAELFSLHLRTFFVPQENNVFLTHYARYYLYIECPPFFFQRYKRMMLIKMMMKRSVLIQLACLVTLALVGLANAAYDFEACSEADCGEECITGQCASKSREAFVLSLHRRWVCCSCMCALLYGKRRG